MISTELKERIKLALRKYENTDEKNVFKEINEDIMWYVEVTDEMRDCLKAVLKENMNEMINNLKK